MPRALYSPITDDQAAALQRFASSNGRSWKAALRFCWEISDYKFHASEDDVPHLQALRNSRGPRWLKHCKLGKQAVHYSRPARRKRDERISAGPTWIDF
jgi:hypothetical protein